MHLLRFKKKGLDLRRSEASSSDKKLKKYSIFFATNLGGIDYYLLPLKKEVS